MPDDANTKACEKCGKDPFANPDAVPLHCQHCGKHLGMPGYTLMVEDSNGIAKRACRECAKLVEKVVGEGIDSAFVHAAEHQGQLFLATGVDTKGNPRELDCVSPTTLMRTADLVIDVPRGTVTKSRCGKTSVAVPQPIPVPKTPTLEDRLLLRHAESFEFGGMVDGCGFLVRVERDPDGEGWRMIRHTGDPSIPFDPQAFNPVLLCDVQTRHDPAETCNPDGLAWVPELHKGGLLESDEAWPRRYDTAREAVLVALDVCDGRVLPSEIPVG